MPQFLCHTPRSILRRVFLLRCPSRGHGTAASAMAQTPPVDGRRERRQRGRRRWGARSSRASPSGAEQRAVTEADGRFTVRVTTPGACHAHRARHGFKESASRARRGRPAVGSAAVARASRRHRGRHRHLDAQRTAARRRRGQREHRRSRRRFAGRPAVVADDVLRQIPSFSLFRRTSSLSSHPTAQGVSLRGIGPSGVSRTLVLLDGVPFNDPFGGWVYWTRVPLESADRIEVIDGTTSSLYGNFAMGGVINIVTAPPTPRTLELRTQYGSRNSPKIDVRASDVWGRFGASVDFGAFDTEGYPIVAESERGAGRHEGAGATSATPNLRLQYDAIEPRAGLLARAATSARSATTRRSARSTARPRRTTREWTSVSAGVRDAARRRQRAQAQRLHRLTRRSTATSWPCPPRRRCAASAG